MKKPYNKNCYMGEDMKKPSTLEQIEEVREELADLRLSFRILLDGINATADQKSPKRARKVRSA
jgi:hypothetical protein